jgi:hypothetical protein
MKIASANPVYRLADEARTFMFSIMQVANSLVDTLVAPSIKRAKS